MSLVTTCLQIIIDQPYHLKGCHGDHGTKSGSGGGEGGGMRPGNVEKSLAKCFLDSAPIGE